jgi:hypothetical protein
MTNETNVSLHEKYKMCTECKIVDVFIMEKEIYLHLLSEDCKKFMGSNFANEGKGLAVLWWNIK